MVLDNSFDAQACHACSTVVLKPSILTESGIFYPGLGSMHAMQKETDSLDYCYQAYSKTCVCRTGLTEPLCSVHW